MPALAVTRARFSQLALLAAASLAAARFPLRALAGPAAAVEPQAAGTYVMVAADPHYLSPRLNDRGPFFQALMASSDGKVMRYVDELLDAFVDAVLAERPRALVLAGDLTYNGALQSHEDLAAKLRRIVDAGIAVLVLPGNHDVYCDAAARFEGDGYEFVPSATAEDFARIWGAFGYDAALSRDEASLSYVYELTPDLRLLFVDANARETPCAVPQPTLAWVEGQLVDALGAGAHVVSVTHQSLLGHTFASEGYVVANAGELLGLYRRYGVWANLCGHLHVQHVMRDEQGFAEMATSALSVAPNHFARLVATPLDGVDVGVSVVQAPGGDAAEQAWPVFVDGQGRLLRDPLQLRYATAPMGDLVSAWAERQGSDDPNLLDFEAYARAFFDGTADARNAMILELAYNGFAEAVEMVDFLFETNYAYFSGRLDLVEPQPELVARWREADAVIGYYLTYVYELAAACDQNQLSAVLL